MTDTDRNAWRIFNAIQLVLSGADLDRTLVGRPLPSRIRGSEADGCSVGKQAGTAGRTGHQRTA